VTVVPDGDRRSRRPPGIVGILAVWLALATLPQGLRPGWLPPRQLRARSALELRRARLVASISPGWSGAEPRAPGWAAYVFLTHEIVRGVHFHRRDAVALAALWVLVLQLPASRRWMPSLRPARCVRAGACGRRPNGGGRAGAAASDTVVDVPRRGSPLW
jgi:hypothetical protein